MIEAQEAAAEGAHGAVPERLVPEAIQGGDRSQILIREELHIIQRPVVGAAGFHELLHEVNKQVSDILTVGQLGGHVQQPPGQVLEVGFHLRKDTKRPPEGSAYQALGQV